MPSDTRMRIEPTKTLTESAATIIGGTFGSGGNISEDRLATAFGVSPTPSRDALSAPQFTGLVVARPKRGSCDQRVDILVALKSGDWDTVTAALTDHIISNRMAAEAS